MRLVQQDGCVVVAAEGGSLHLFEVSSCEWLSHIRCGSPLSCTTLHSMPFSHVAEGKQAADDSVAIDVAVVDTLLVSCNTSTPPSPLLNPNAWHKCLSQLISDCCIFCFCVSFRRWPACGRAGYYHCWGRRDDQRICQPRQSTYTDLAKLLL